MSWRPRILMPALGVAAVVVAALAWTQLPGIGAGAILRPSRRPIHAPPPNGCRDVTFQVEVGTLRGWHCRAEAPRLATVIYLHGIADNRASGAGVLARYVRQNLDAVSNDSRAHGASDGDACTYGYHEKEDLRRVIDTLEPGPVVLIGTSLGAAVALQYAAADPRVKAVVAAESFSSLRAVATERVPFIFTAGFIERSFSRAEQEARFHVDAVSPSPRHAP